MVLYAAGQRIRGSEINALPQLYRVAAPQICNNSATLRDVQGLAFAGEVNAGYLVEGFLAVHAHESGDIKIAWSVPSGTVQSDSPALYYGSWHAVYGLDWASSGGTPGAVDTEVKATLTTAIDKSGDNLAPTLIMPVAFVQLGGSPGTVKMQFAQRTSFVHDTTVRVGSCIRVSRQV